MALRMYIGDRREELLQRLESEGFEMRGRHLVPRDPPRGYPTRRSYVFAGITPVNPVPLAYLGPTEMVIEEFQKLKTERINSLMFSASIERLLNLYGDVFNQSSSMLAEKVADAFANDDEELKVLHSYPENLRRLTTRKIMTLANKHINPQSSVRAIIKPA